MHILISGGTGFIGQRLCKHWIRDHSLTILSRQSGTEVKKKCGSDVTPIQSLSEIKQGQKIDVIVNLAGAPIADKRWTKQRKRQLMSSRLDTTRALVDLIHRLEYKPKVFISGSAVGYYGDQGKRNVNESTPPHPEFSHHLCQDWENAALQAKDATRVCLLRTGLVIGQHGGFLDKMKMPFKYGLGSVLGSGNQYMPWIHLDDMIAIIQFLMDHPDIHGPVNASAPNPVTNIVFSEALANAFGRKVRLKTPAFVLKLALGELSGLLLTGQNARPTKLLEAGYTFRFSELDAALRDVID